MKKINKKGVTIAELVVSFALVSVAVIYFYQTLSTVSELYTISRTETQEYVDKTYALRLLDAYIEKTIGDGVKNSTQCLNFSDDKVTRMLKNNGYKDVLTEKNGLQVSILVDAPLYSSSDKNTRKCLEITTGSIEDYILEYPLNLNINGKIVKTNYYKYISK